VELVARLKTLLESLGKKAPEAAPRPLPVVERHLARRRTLRCDLLLTTGPASIPLFPAGPIEEFQFFQRFGVSADHDVEFLTRLDAEDAGTENYRAYGIFRLRGPWLPMPDLGRDRLLARRLENKYGLERLPNASRLAPPTFAAGVNRLRPPAMSKPFRKVRGRCYYFADLLEILRGELTGSQKVAWIEEALPPPPPHSPVVHRYYLDSSRQAYLVRDHRGVGKRLYVARTSEEALEPCLASTRAHARPSLVREALPETRRAPLGALPHGS
jgi:hypothetical protein